MNDDIRKDFPILDSNIVYLDSACQSLRPRQVIEAMNRYYLEFPACGGRSMHRLGNMVGEEVERARADVAKFLNAKKKEEIVFTRNTTEGINLIANSLGLKRGDIVVTSDKEHNSNLVPWQLLTERVGINHKIIPSKKDGSLDMQAFERIMNPDVKLVSMVYTSNLDGVSNPVREIIKTSHKYKYTKVLLDAAQSAPHGKIDVRSLDVDFLVFSGHKMLGPSGTGVLYGKQDLLKNLSPFLVGGDTVSDSTYETADFLPAPEKFEAGLQDYAGIIGLGEAVRYLEKVGLNNIEKHETDLNKLMTEGLKDVPGLKILGSEDPEERGGIFSFYFENVDVHQIALMLDSSASIMVRSGMHCVHSWFNSRKIKGSVRASLYLYNNEKDVEYFIENLKKVAAIL